MQPAEVWVVDIGKLPLAVCSLCDLHYSEWWGMLESGMTADVFLIGE